MASDWVEMLVKSLGLLYDDVLATVNEAQARYPQAGDAITAVATWLKEHVGDRVKNPTALAALIYGQISAGGSDPDAGADV